MYEIYAKRAGKSVANYLGGDISIPIPYYASETVRAPWTAQDVGNLFVGIHDDFGVNQFKLKMAQRMGNNTDERLMCSKFP